MEYSERCSGVFFLSDRVIDKWSFNTKSYINTSILNDTRRKILCKRMEFVVESKRPPPKRGTGGLCLAKIYRICMYLSYAKTAWKKQ